MAYELIRFTLADPHLEKLRGLVEDQESLHLAAKRLLLTLLGDEQSLSLDLSKALEQRLETLEQRLNTSSNTNTNPTIDYAIEQRLEAVEAALEQVSNTGNNAGNVTGLEQRLEALEQTLEQVSNTRASDQPSDSPVNLEELEMRVHMLEETLQTSDSQPSDINLQPIEQRLATLEQKLDEVFNTGNNTGNVTDLEQRLATLEERLRNKTGWLEDLVNERASEAVKYLSDIEEDILERFNVFEDGVEAANKRSQESPSHRSFARVVERLGNIDNTLIRFRNYIETLQKAVEIDPSEKVEDIGELPIDRDSEIEGKDEEWNIWEANDRLRISPKKQAETDLLSDSPATKKRGRPKKGF